MFELTGTRQERAALTSSCSRWTCTIGHHHQSSRSRTPLPFQKRILKKNVTKVACHMWAISGKLFVFVSSNQWRCLSRCNQSAVSRHWSPHQWNIDAWRHQWERIRKGWDNRAPRPSRLLHSLARSRTFGCEIAARCCTVAHTWTTQSTQTEDKELETTEEKLKHNHETQLSDKRFIETI